MKEIRKYLIQISKEEGICDYGLKHITEDAWDALLKYYIVNPDWCMERGLPDIDIIREIDRKIDLEEYGIYVDKHFDGEVLLDRQAYIFHNCSGKICTGLNVEKKIIPMLYFGNNCNMILSEVAMEKKSYIRPIAVPVYSFGQNALLKDENEIHFIIYREEVKK